ncbi:MAG: hypothetical protein JSW21_07490 [Gammaproteobacteria bacterium]|nr:MAG: hypothetical protein JSW21_07490 [Gammaproteobacteria bacterium]
MKITVENMDRIHAWAMENQDAVPAYMIQLSFTVGLAKSVLEQEMAPDPERVIEIGYEISDLLWRIRALELGGAQAGQQDWAGGGKAGKFAAGTRVILHAIRQGHMETGEIVEYIEKRVGKSVSVAEVVGHDDTIDMPIYGFREIRITRDGNSFGFHDLSDDPCRDSTMKHLRKAIAAARRHR